MSSNLPIQNATLTARHPSNHPLDCTYHVDQYPHECTCGLLRPKPNRLKRIKDVQRVEHVPYEGWIARNQLGEEIFESGFRWNSRRAARNVALESDILGPFPTPWAFHGDKNDTGERS